MPRRRPKPFDRAIRSVGLGFQMLAIIGIGVFIGDRLDRHFQTETPYWTAGTTLFFTIIAIYLAVRDLIRDQ